MTGLDIKDIARAVGADYSGEGTVADVVTDSRKAGPGSLFVPIVGDLMDGHSFIDAAFGNGAAFALSARRDIPDNGRILYVTETKQAHIDIGALYRDRFNIKIVGITGSVGKTTTKEFVAAVLESRYKVLKNKGNKNNEIGLPETLFQLDAGHEAAVLEMGMSGLGEIHALTMAVRPDVAVITNVYGVHLEYLGSIENVRKAKLEIIDGMKPGSPLFLCGDNDMLRGTRLPGVDCIFFGVANPDCQIRAINVVDNGLFTTFDIRSVYGDYPVRIPTTGAHFVLDALAAFGVGCVLGIEPERAAAALENYAPAGMRQRPVSFMGGIVMEDCYNASPVSMQGAIDTLKAMPCTGRRIAVFSDMRELGETAREKHLAVGRTVAEAKIDKLLIWGKDARYYIEGAREVGGVDCRAYDTKAELAAAIREFMSPGDIVWVKGSRGMMLEDVLAALYGGGGHE